MELRIKDLRRIETELDKELSHKSRIHIDRYCNMQFKSAEQATEYTQSKILSKIEIAKSLYKIKFDIRKIIGEFNEKSGINDRTLAIAEWTQELEMVNSVAALSTTRRTSDSYQSKDYYYTEGVSDTFIEEMRAESRRILRKIQSLKDSCAGTNANAKITISEEMENALRKLGMID